MPDQPMPGIFVPVVHGEGPINSLFSRDHSRLFAMRLTRLDCAADESGPFRHMPPDAFDDRVLDSSIFHTDRTGGMGISFQVLNLGGIRTMGGEPTPFGRFSRPGALLRRSGASGTPFILVCRADRRSNPSLV
jgi:hypothetical protein